MHSKSVRPLITLMFKLALFQANGNILSVTASITKVEWMDFESLTWSTLEPAGMQTVGLQYVGRAQHLKQETFIPGKFYTHPPNSTELHVLYVHGCSTTICLWSSWKNSDKYIKMKVKEITTPEIAIYLP